MERYFGLAATARRDGDAAPARDNKVAAEREGEAAAAAFVHNEQAFLPFSTGPMNCPGKALAMQEIRMVVTALVQRFRVRLREGWDSGFYEREIRDYFNATRPRVPVVLEKRW